MLKSPPVPWHVWPPLQAFWQTPQSEFVINETQPRVPKFPWPVGQQTLAALGGTLFGLAGVQASPVTHSLVLAQVCPVGVVPPPQTPFEQV